MGYVNDSPKRYFKIKAGYIVLNIKEANEAHYEQDIEQADAVKKYVNDNGVDMIDVCYRGISGYLKNISMQDFTYNDVTTTSYSLTLEESGVDYIINFQEDSGISLGVINALASMPDLTEKITIKAYLGDGKNRVSVYVGNERLAWKAQKEELPPLTQLTYTNPETGKQMVVLDPKTKKPMLDNTKRLAFIKDLANDIQLRLTGKNIVHYKSNGIADPEPDAVPAEVDKF